MLTVIYVVYELILNVEHTKLIQSWREILWGFIGEYAAALGVPDEIESRLADKLCQWTQSQSQLAWISRRRHARATTTTDYESSGDVPLAGVLSACMFVCVCVCSFVRFSESSTLLGAYNKTTSEQHCFSSQVSCRTITDKDAVTGYGPPHSCNARMMHSSHI